MRGAVAADETGAVEREHHGQVLQRHIVHQLVVAALQEGGVDRDHGLQALAGEPGGEGDRVLLGDRDIEVALREAARELDETRAFAHRRRDADHLRVALGHVAEPVAEHLREGRTAGLLFEDRAARRVEGAGSVPGDGVGLGGRIALALARHHMQELRSGQPPLVAQRLHQRADVVAVDGADVVEAELLEERARQHHALEVGLGAARQLPHRGHPAQHLLAGLAQRGVLARRQDAREIVGERTHVLRDRHVVVVEHDQQVGLQRAGVVERLEGLPGGDRAVADHRDHAPRDALLLRADRHAERGADRGARVADAEGVVGAFAARREGREAVLLLDRREPVTPAREHLVRIGLMADIPHQAVLGRVVDIVQRHRQLDGA